MCQWHDDAQQRRHHPGDKPPSPGEQRTSSRPGLSNGRCGSPRWREHTGSCFVPVGSRCDRPGRHGCGRHLPLSPRRDIRQTATLWNPLNQASYAKGFDRASSSCDAWPAEVGIWDTVSSKHWRMTTYVEHYTWVRNQSLDARVVFCTSRPNRLSAASHSQGDHGCPVSTPVHVLMGRGGNLHCPLSPCGPVGDDAGWAWRLRCRGGGISLALEEAAPAPRLKTTTGWRNRGREALCRVSRAEKPVKIEERVR